VAAAMCQESSRLDQLGKPLRCQAVIFERAERCRSKGRSAARLTTVRTKIPAAVAWRDVSGTPVEVEDGRRV